MFKTSENSTREEILGDTLIAFFLTQCCFFSMNFPNKFHQWVSVEKFNVYV